MEGSSDKAEETKEEIPPREQRLEWYMNTFKKKDFLLAEDEKETDYDSDGSHNLTFRDFASYLLDMYETGGFDVQDYSKVNDTGMIRTYYHPAAGINTDALYLPHIIECACLAMTQYNADKGTHFDFENVIKTNVEPGCAYRFFITFEATDGTQGIKETFEAVVNVGVPTSDKTVTLVQLRQPPRFFTLEDSLKEMADLNIAPHCVRCG